MRFDGNGDSGLIEDFTTEPASVTIGQELQAELEEFLAERLPGGWEINEGSSGDIKVDVASGRIEVSGYWHVERETEPQVTRWRFRQ